MAATYEPIATSTVSGTTTTTVSFTGIDSVYTDLKVIVVATSINSSSTLVLRLNNDTTTNYSYIRLRGNGTAASTTIATAASSIPFDTTGTSTTIPSLYIFDIFNYAGSTFKPILATGSEDRNGSGNIWNYAASWRSTTAVNRVDIALSSANFTDGSMVTLYGIKAA